uniref:Mating fator 2.3 n=1 Tax=Ustilago esculenta TaxID=185366 RepID=A0A0U2YP96_9BASI|nr:mating fator 2.3 [Ustilago esculenta]QBH67621.1 pheromone Mfa2.3 [Ustilago esculenta]QBH70120.1 mating fator a2.3 [Ustilago esculenta]
MFAIFSFSINSAVSTEQAPVDQERPDQRTFPWSSGCIIA